MSEGMNLLVRLRASRQRGLPSSRGRHQKLWHRVGGSSHLKTSVFRMSLLTSNDLIKKNPSQLYPAPLVLVNFRYS